MGKGMGKGKGISDNCLFFTVVILNVLCGILGALIFSLAIWMRLESEVKDWVRELEITQYWNGLYILMAAGAIIMLISFCGCCGAFMTNKCLLATNLSMTSLTFVLLLFGASILLANVIRPTLNYEHLNHRFEVIINHRNAKTDEFLIFLWYRSAVFVIITLILELTGSIFILVNATESSKLTPYLEKTLNKIMIDSNYNDRANRILQVVQEKVGCCGANSYQDYTRNRLPISDYCRDVVSGNIYQEGCVQRLSVFLEKRAGWIAGIALLIGFIQIMLVCVTFCYWRVMPENYDDDVGPKRYTEVPQKAY